MRKRGIATWRDKGHVRGFRGKTTTRAPNKPPVVRKRGTPPQPSVCERCGAVFDRRTWRWRGARRGWLPHSQLEKAAWVVCPACEQAREGEYYGRVVIRGAYAAANEAEIRRRIRNVEKRARFTHPQRRLVSKRRTGPVLEVLTTSQKLAHRIVHELKKAFGGRASYAWSTGDGELYATWERGDLPAAKPAPRRAGAKKG